MTVASESTLQILRKAQRSRLHLFVFQPPVVFKARVNSSTIARGARVIPYNNVTYGNHTDIIPGMTMWVGTYEGGDDVGHVRVRSASATQLVVAENADINWANGLYITVVNFFEIWPVFPRYVQNPSNKEEVIFYKDYDIAYTNQNALQNLGVFFRVGPHRASSVVPAQFYFSAQGTHVVGSSTITGYQWSFPGGTPSAATGETPGWVTYNSPGFYTVSLTVTLSSGVQETTYRHVIVTNGDQVKTFALDGLEGRVDDGGWTAKITVFNPAQTGVLFKTGFLVIITSDDYYDSVAQGIGGNYASEERILFCGYISGEEGLQYDYTQKTLQFTAVSPSIFANNLLMFPVEVQDSSSAPNVWWKLQGLTCKRAIYHFLRWHSTLLQTNDFIWNVSSDPPLQIFATNRQSIYEAIRRFLEEARGCLPICDRQGAVYVEQLPEYVFNAFSTLPVACRPSKIDYGRPTVSLRNPDTAFIQTGGVIYSGGKVTPVLSAAPGNVPAARGISYEDRQGFAVTSQDELNKITGALFSSRSFPIENVALDFRGKYGNFDVAPIEITEITLSNDESGGIGEIAIRGYSQQISFSPQDNVLYTRISLRPITDAFVGITVEVPPDPPPPEPPPPPPPPPGPPSPEPPPPIPPPFPQTVVVLAPGPRYDSASTPRAWATNNFNDDSPTWFPLDNLPEFIGWGGEIRDVVVTWGGGVYVMYNRENNTAGVPPSALSVLGLYYAPFLGGTLQRVASLQDLQGFGGGDLFLGTGVARPASYSGQQHSIYFLLCSGYTGSRFTGVLEALPTNVRQTPLVWGETPGDASYIQYYNGAYISAQALSVPPNIVVNLWTDEALGVTHEQSPTYGWGNNAAVAAVGGYSSSLVGYGPNNSIYIRQIAPFATTTTYDMTPVASQSSWWRLVGVRDTTSGPQIWVVRYDAASGAFNRLGYLNYPYTTFVETGIAPGSNFVGGAVLPTFLILKMDDKIYITYDGNTFIDKTGNFPTGLIGGYDINSGRINKILVPFIWSE